MPTTAPDLSCITLTEVVFLECTILQPGPGFINLASASNVNLSTNIEFAFNRDNHFLSTRLSIQVQPVDEEGQALPLSARFHIHFGFIVENLDELLDAGSLEEEPTPNIMLTLSLLSVSYSTSRGMILGKVAGTPFEGYCLPLMDAREILSYAADSTRTHQEPASAQVKAQRGLEARAKQKAAPRKKKAPEE